ncbi:TetR/AcrR family transcriptional regulator [Parasulfitobacter algicola]|uniref:TetR/AcrR family transcriptional regulator n=1 Tax=Parasulfitobacter algicola TaxID=2614809 RepID=A0ABX2J074_9RHOB|nr:TetR/AcrR family transcriptional regulator [Sulfitobacter algicola]NSX56481.1 TetR/AcrR family transcriptional regulator [Sulfitobacter algicola]
MTTALPDFSPDPRVKDIMGAAFETFATYGYRRTAMEDIAKTAGMSRSALYLHFKNKEDIFRSLAQYYYDAAAEGMTKALQNPGPLAQVLHGAFVARGAGIMETVLSSPHGEELLDTKSTTIADVSKSGEAKLAGIFADWLKHAKASGQIRLMMDPDVMADTIMAALKGLKTPPPSLDVYRERQQVLAEVLAQALSH